MKQDGNEAFWEKYDNFGYKGSTMFINGGAKVEKDIKTNATYTTKTKISLVRMHRMFKTSGITTTKLRSVIFWQRDGPTGKKEAKFYVRLKKGRYNIKYYMGDARIPAEMIYFKGATFDMSFAMNEKTLMKNEKVYSGKQKIETVEVEIGNEELLELTLDGIWIINALEIQQLK